MDSGPGGLHHVVVETRDGKRAVRLMPWGLKRRGFEASGELQLHARAETLLERPMFRDLVLGRRCIVPTQWWAEGRKSIRVDGISIVGVAGLYDAWSNPDGSITETFCIITVEAEDELRDLNTRRPAILRLEDEAVWLSRSERDVDRILATLHSFHGAFVIESGRPRRRSDAPVQQAFDVLPPRRPE